MLRFMDSFDHYTSLLDKWTGATNFYGITGSYSRFGGQSGFARGGYVRPSSIYKTIDAQTDWYIGAAVYIDQSLTTEIMWLGSGLTRQIAVAWDATTRILSLSNGSTLATGTTPVPPGTWVYIELGAHIHSSAGSATVRLNGLTECSVSSVNTNPVGSGTANVVALGTYGNMPNDQTIYFDDHYACDGQGSVNNTFLGDVRVQALLPTSDGANTAWATSSGSTHYNLVNEVPPDGDTSYVTSSTVGQVDEYGMTPIAVSSGTVAGVQVLIYARKNDAGTRTIAPVVREGGTDYVGTSQALSTSYVYLSQIYEADPATSAAWTISGINGDQFGVKVTG